MMEKSVITSPAVLYVEDDPGQRILMHAFLERFGCRVKTADHAFDALELILEYDFDIALLDYDLPDMTGAQLAQEIRSVRPGVRIIVLSGHVYLPPGELGYVDAYVLKGLPIKELVDTISNLVFTSSHRQWAGLTFTQK